MRKPRWGDDEAVFKHLVRRMDEIRAEAEWLEGSNPNLVPAYIPGMGWIEVTPPAHMPTRAHELMLGLAMAENERALIKARKILPEGEGNAVAESLCGNQEPLSLLLQNHFFPVEGIPRVKRLSEPTCLLVLEYIRGERNPETGKKKGDHGPRLKTALERRELTPTHDAADLVPVIEAILRDMFPGHKAKEISERAIEFAAKIKRIDKETLARHLGRGPRDRHRL